MIEATRLESAVAISNSVTIEEAREMIEFCADNLHSLLPDLRYDDVVNELEQNLCIEPDYLDVFLFHLI